MSTENAPNTSPQNTTPAGGGTSSPPGSSSAGPSAAEFEALRARLAQYEAADTEKARAQAAAERAKLEKRAEDAEKRANSLHEAARKQAALNALQGLRKPDFLPLVMDKVQLDDAGLLTEDSKKAVQAWRDENPFLFEDATPPAPKPGNHPAPAPKAGQGTKFSAEEQARIDRYSGGDGKTSALAKLFS